MKVRLKGLNSVTIESRGGEKITYLYAWKGGPRLLHDDGTPITSVLDPQLHAAFAKAHADAKKTPGVTLSKLIADFLASSAFKKLAPKTQKDYRAYIKRIEERFGVMPDTAIEDRRARGQFKKWRDEIAEKSGDRAADYGWTVLARILSVAKDHGAIGINVCERGGRLYDGDRNDKIWSDAVEAKYYAGTLPYLHLPLLMALWTGQREGDLLKITWLQYDGKYIRLAQGKSRGKRRVTIPVGAPLKLALDTLKATIVEETGKPPDGAILRTMRGNRQWTEDGFRSSFGKACDAAGIEDLTFHDTRGTAVTRLAIAGAEVPEIATITGHSLKTVQEILDKHYLNRDVAMAESAIMKLEASKGFVRITGLSVVAGGKG